MRLACRRWQAGQDQAGLNSISTNTLHHSYQREKSMNTAVEKLFLDAASNRHLDWLESEAIHIMREVAAECSNPALLFSGGKDSVVLLRIAEKAFRPGSFPFPLVHIDTGHNFEEVIAFRDKRVAELGERLIVGSVEDSIRRGTVRLRNPL